MTKTNRFLTLPQNAFYDEMQSPVGNLTIIASSAGLHTILWDNDQDNVEAHKKIHQLIQSSNDPIITKTKNQLMEYFEGKRKAFDLLLAPTGTPFQIQAWQQLLAIPYGETISYGEQAKRIGDKKKARAVGMANGRNPISIIIPCHRVIGSNGKLVGFGGGLENKDYLLNLEKKYL